MESDERHEDFAEHNTPALVKCPACEEDYPEDEGTLMAVGGVEWEDQPHWCPGCAGECAWMVEGYGVR